MSGFATDRQVLIRSILASDDPAASLLRALEDLDARRDLSTQAAVFEALVWRIERLDYWVWYRMSRVYAELGRNDLAFFCSVRTVQIDPERGASLQPFREMLHHFRQGGNAEAAVDVAVRQRRSHPQQPILSDSELEALCQTAGLDPVRYLNAQAAHNAAEAAIFPRLANAIRYTFRQPNLAVQPGTTADDVPGWDSLSHATLITHVEQAFGITFALTEILDLPDVGALAALVARTLRAGRRRKLILYGNCQAGALAVVLRNTPAIAAHYDIVEHDLWAQGDALERNLADFDAADALLLQDVRNWRDHPRRHTLPAGLRIVRFPFYYVAALWPFDAMVAGPDEPMQQAQRAAQAAGRKFPFGFQDGALARLRQSVADPGERLRRYRDLDFDHRPDIARLAQLDEARLLDDDTKFASTIGRYIVENYRHVRLFHAIAHPTAALIGRLAAELVEKLGFDTGYSGLGSYNDYMGDYQVPLHPAVIRSLGIAWANETTRYEFDRGERLTFDEYYARYIAFPVGG